MRRRESQGIALLCQEPFRIFFPAGLLLGIAGVSLWPAYYAGWVSFYPGTPHARLMIEGFMASFVIGFLGTAGPRITSTRPLSSGELIGLLTLDLLAAGSHFGDSHRLGDVLFVLCLAFFLLAVGKRFLHRKDSPPPNFALVALGLLSGLVGALLLACFEQEAYSVSYRVGAALLEQGFVFLPILGVAPFFLARLLDSPQPEQPESPDLSPAWIRQAAFAAFIGIVIIASFVIETCNLPETGEWIRVAAMTLYLVARLPFRGRSFLADCLRIGIISILVGFVASALVPLSRVGALHIAFIGGVNFIAFTVAIRVVFGHSGNARLFQKRLPFFLVTGGLLFLAMISRFTADIAPGARVVHLISAAICWLAAALLWGVKVIPKVTVAEIEP